jgi:outer membrane protein OmpA-like peptidoglycan-associated protein
MLFFPKNSTVLTDTAKANIIANISPWRNKTGIKILVNGFTDNTGTPMLNEQLSYTRARAVENVILRLGFPDQIMEAQGWGEANPRSDNDTDEHRDLNRRVEIIIRK